MRRATGCEFELRMNELRLELKLDFLETSGSKLPRSLTFLDTVREENFAHGSAAWARAWLIDWREVAKMAAVR